MRLVRTHLRNRIAHYFAFAVVVILFTTGCVVVVLRHRSLVDAMERSARTYAQLVSLPLAAEVESSPPAGRRVLASRVTTLLALDPDVRRLEVVNVGGVVLLRAEGGRVVSYSDAAEAPRVDDPMLLARVRDVRLSAGRIQVPGQAAVYRVVAPAVEEWGRHVESVVLELGYEGVRRELYGVMAVMGGLLVVGLMVADRVAVTLAGTITRSVETLQTRVRRIQDGFLDEQVEVESDDEIGELAEAFNAMSGELNRMIGELRDANRELESLDQAKADLVANVSHELKTPLTALRGYLELLAQGDLGAVPPEAARALDVCLKNVRRLSLRIEELVELSRLEKSGVPHMVMDTVHLGRLLHGVVETMLPRLEEHSLVCSLNLATDLPGITASLEHLERTFLNLLDNAVKFTSPGGIIRVTAEPSTHEGRTGVLVRVADTGVGIPPGEQLRIFDRFYQVDPSARRRYGGMGLGLALVRSIVEAHRGAAWVDSEVGRGSTFFVWLPDRMRESSSGQHAIARGPGSDRLGPSETPPAGMVSES